MKLEEILLNIFKDGDIQVLYDSEILFETEASVVYSENTEYLIKDLDSVYLNFFEYEYELDIPDNINKFYKLLNTIKKTVEKEKPSYMLICNEYPILTEEALEDFYSIDYLIDRVSTLKIYKLKYLTLKNVIKIIKQKETK